MSTVATCDTNLTGSAEGAVKTAPRDARIALSNDLTVAMYHMDNADYDQAIGTLTKIIRHEPAPEAYSLLARCYLEAREHNEALVIIDLAKRYAAKSTTVS